MTMINRIIFITSFAVLLLSCPNDDIVDLQEVGVDGEDMEEIQIENENVIDSFLWAIPVDSTTISNRSKYIVRHVLLHEDKVLFHTPELSGWVALEANTGDEIWSNRGVLNKAEIFDSPLQHEEFMYYMRTSSFLKINMDNGNLELKELWPIGPEFQRNSLAIDGDIIHSTVDEFNNAKPAFEDFLSISVDEIVSPPLNWNRFNEYVAAENEDIVRGSGSPVFYTDLNNRRNLIYASVNMTLNLQTNLFNTVTSYDFEADSIKWERRIPASGPFGSGILIEEDRIYALVDRTMLCLNAETGELIWKAEKRFFDETFAFGAGMHIVGDKIVALGTNSRNIGVDKYTGVVKWFVHYDANHPDRLAAGSRQFAVDVYQDRIYYISGWGQLVSLNPNSGSVRRYYLPDRPVIEEYGIQLFEPSFRLNGMTISDDGIVYLSEGLRFLALEVPDKDL